MLRLVDIPVGHESAYYNTVVPMLSDTARRLLDEFIMKVRSKVKDHTKVGIIIDGGWSHPGWWAREHTVIALDDETGLPLGYKHVLKGVNYFGSSRGIHCLVALLFFHVITQEWKGGVSKR